MKEKKCFILQYKCTNLKTGRHVVIAPDFMAAMNIFINYWNTKHQTNELGVPPEEIDTIEIQRWCDLSDMI